MLIKIPSTSGFRRAVLITLAGLGGFAHALAAVGPTVKEVIEFTRIIQPVQLDDATLQTQVSPDGDQAFIITRTADVATDKNRFEILLMDVRPAQLASSKAKGSAPEPAKLLVVDSAHDRDDAEPTLRDAKWVGSRTLVFRARMDDEPYQAYRIDVLTRKLTQLTFAPYGIVGFDVSDDLRRVVYASYEPNPAYTPSTRAVVAEAKSFWSVHGQQDNFDAQLRRYQFFFVEAGSRTPARPLGTPFWESGSRMAKASFSPNGRWVLLAQFRPDGQLAWGRQYPQIGERMKEYSHSLLQDPIGYYSRPSLYVTRQMMAYRVADGSERTVIDAPDDATGLNLDRADRIWQNGGASVVIAGTYLPHRDGDAPATAASSHIIEYWPESGEWKPIAVLQNRLKHALPIPGALGDFVAVDGDKRRVFRRDAQGRWHEADGAARDEKKTADASSSWRLQVRQALNQPPDIVAVGPAAQEVRLTELNPQFSAAQWGVMKPYSWKDAKGRPWDGGLMVPADFDPRKKYPLVIQTYGFSPTRFYRDGTNTYDGATSGFAGRAFLREGMLVLALPWRASNGAPSDEHNSIVSFGEGVRGAVDALVDEGWVDRGRIGILGWSATGVRVLNLVTFTDVPVRAATLIDGDANTIYSMTITSGRSEGIQQMKESANEGGPFGEARERWIRNDPSLYTDCVHAALRIESYGAEVKNNWDIYALLRRQHRPVELLKFPEGAHALSRPSERMISLQGNVDWYRFWLKGERRSEVLMSTETAESLKGQYARWDQMLPMKLAVDATPRCVRTALGE